MIHTRRRTRLPVPITVAAALLLTACAPGGTDEPDAATVEERTAPDRTTGGAKAHDASDGGGGEGELEPVEADVEEALDPAAAAAEVGADELGQVPVLMYHRLLDDGGGDFDETPAQFEAELRRLHAEGYVPTSTADLIDGFPDLPAGASPVVLTFDDSTREQFGLDEDGQVDPDTAVGIMLRLEDELDGFEAAGSFYVLGSLFGAGEDRGRELLAALHGLGFEVGNHTADHDHLGALDDAGVQRALAAGVANIEAAVPDAEVRTMSYPFGVRPHDPALVAGGEHAGVRYAHEAALLVGSGPAPSPFDVDFDPLAVPRIRSQPDPVESDEPDWGSGYWLDVLADEPERRYVSDGDPDTVAFPRDRAERLVPAARDRALPY